MTNLKNKLTDYLIASKVRPVLKRLSNNMNFPEKASCISKVLVIMPRNMSMLQDANRFIQVLRKYYPGWRVELFDADKLTANDLDRMSLPREAITDKLRQAGYQFVMDLNDVADPVSAYIALMTEAAYRLHLVPEGSDYFNLTFQIHQNDAKDRGEDDLYYDPLVKYLGKLFVKNK